MEHCQRYLLCWLLLLPVAVNASGNDAGMALLQKDCSGCHDLTGPAPTTIAGVWQRQGPDLFYAGNKYKPAWLKTWLQKPVRIRPAGMYYGRHIKEGADGDVIDSTTLKPHPRLNGEQAKAVTEALMSLRAGSHLINEGEYKPGKISMAMGELMFDKFRGCLACHEIEEGYGGLSGPEVYSAGNRLQEDFMISYMRDPQAWDPRIFMPNKHLKDRDLQKFVHFFRALAAENEQ